MEKKYICILLILFTFLIIYATFHNNNITNLPNNLESFTNKQINNNCPIVNGIQTIPDTDGLSSPAKNAKNCYVYPLNPYLRPMGVQLNCKCKFPTNNSTKYPGLCAECYTDTK